MHASPFPHVCFTTLCIHLYSAHNTKNRQTKEKSSKVDYKSHVTTPLNTGFEYQTVTLLLHTTQPFITAKCLFLTYDTLSCVLCNDGISCNRICYLIGQLYIVYMEMYRVSMQRVLVSTPLSTFVNKWSSILKIQKNTMFC